MTATLVLTKYEGSPPKHLYEALEAVGTNKTSYLKGLCISRSRLSCVYQSMYDQFEDDTLWILSDDFLNDRRSQDILKLFKRFDRLLTALHKGAQLYNVTENELKSIGESIPEVYITESHHVPTNRIPDICNRIVFNALNEETDQVSKYQQELNNFICKFNTYKKS